MGDRCIHDFVHRYTSGSGHGLDRRMKLRRQGDCGRAHAGVCGQIDQTNRLEVDRIDGLDDHRLKVSAIPDGASEMLINARQQMDDQFAHLWARVDRSRWFFRLPFLQSNDGQFVALLGCHLHRLVSEFGSKQEPTVAYNRPSEE
jgi:hypothetical protein